MKVKDILPKKVKLEREFECLQRLEKLFSNDKDLAEEIAEKAGCNLSLNLLIPEVRMKYADLISEIDRKIREAELPEQ